MLNIQKILSEDSEKLKNKFFRKSFDTIQLIEYCVDKSTIRAFHQSKGCSKKYQPLSIFRTWAYTYLSRSETVFKFKQKADFKTIRSDALRSLKRYWTTVDGGHPEFYQFNKLIDLLFKCIPLWTSLDKETSHWIFQNTNVPLDTYSLDLLRCCNENSVIPRGVSMNHVNKRNYQQYQFDIMELCGYYPKILFDLYAWDNRKKKQKKLREEFKLIPLKKRSESIPPAL